VAFIYITGRKPELQTLGWADNAKRIDWEAEGKDIRHEDDIGDEAMFLE